MFLQRKIDRAFKKLHEGSDHSEQELYIGPDAERNEELPELEKNDFLAMVIAALITILPAALLVLGGLALLGYYVLFH